MEWNPTLREIGYKGHTCHKRRCCPVTNLLFGNPAPSTMGRTCHLSLGPTPNKLALAQRCIYYIVLSLQSYSTNAPQLSTQFPTTPTSCTSRIHGMVRTIIVMKRGTKLPTRRAREATSKYKNRINPLQARLRALFAVVDYAVLHDGSLPEPAPQGDPLQICTATCCIIGKRPSPAPKTKTSTIKRTLRQPKNSLVARSDRVLRPRANLDSNRKA